MGFVYHSMNNYSFSVNFYQKAIEIDEEILSPNHLSLGTTYNDIAVAYDSMNVKENVVFFHKKQRLLLKKKYFLSMIVH